MCSHRELIYSRKCAPEGVQFRAQHISWYTWTPFQFSLSNWETGASEKRNRARDWSEEGFVLPPPILPAAVPLARSSLSITMEWTRKERGCVQSMVNQAFILRRLVVLFVCTVAGVQNRCRVLVHGVLFSRVPLCQQSRTLMSSASRCSSNRLRVKMKTKISFRGRPGIDLCTGHQV